MFRSVLSMAVVVAVTAGFVLSHPPARSQDAGKSAVGNDQSKGQGSKPKAQPEPDSQDEPSARPSPAPDPALAPAAAPETPKKGAVAPDFTLKDMQGNTVRLSSLKGKAVIVNFWATWCEPCKIEMPWLVDLQKKYGPQGLLILGVAMDDAEDQEIREFAKKMGVNYPVLKGTEALADLYGGLDGLPSTFFVDRSGKISDEAIGLMSQAVIEESIKHALEQSRANTGENQR